MSKESNTWEGEGDCGLRHELSSPAQTLGSWVQIPLKALMPLCAYSVCVLFYV
jgi:hypothetical protein